MHTGTLSKKLKTEVPFVPKRNDASNTTDLIPIVLSDGTQITFTNQFTYLGSVITSNLSDDADVNQRINAFGSLR